MLETSFWVPPPPIFSISFICHETGFTKVFHILLCDILLSEGMWCPSEKGSHWQIKGGAWDYQFPISFIFMQFWAKILSNNRYSPKFRGLRPRLKSLGSASVHQISTLLQITSC